MEAQFNEEEYNQKQFRQEQRIGFTDVGNSVILAFQPLINLSRDRRRKEIAKKDAEIKEVPCDMGPIRDVIKDSTAYHRLPNKFFEDIVLFAQGLSKDYGGESCYNLINNLSSIKIRGVAFQPKRPMNLPDKISAFYSSLYNEMFIQVGEQYDLSAFLDAFMRVSCSNARASGVMGFNYKYDDKYYGTELTDGYTTLLNLRTFYEKGYRIPSLDTYFVWRRTPVNDNYQPDPDVHVGLGHCIASMLEMVVGEGKMQECFFGAKPEKFATEVLTRYEYEDPEGKVRDFLSKLDRFPEDNSINYEEIITTVCKWFYAKHLRSGMKISDQERFDFVSRIPSAYFDGEKEVLINRERILNEAKHQAAFEYVESKSNNTGFTKAGIAPQKEVIAPQTSIYR